MSSGSQTPSTHSKMTLPPGSIIEPDIRSVLSGITLPTVLDGRESVSYEDNPAFYSVGRLYAAYDDGGKRVHDRCSVSIVDIEGYATTEAGFVGRTAAHCLNEINNAADVSAQFTYKDSRGTIGYISSTASDFWKHPLYDAWRDTTHYSKVDTALVFFKFDDVISKLPDAMVPVKLVPGMEAPEHIQCLGYSSDMHGLSISAGKVLTRGTGVYKSTCAFREGASGGLVFTTGEDGAVFDVGTISSWLAHQLPNGTLSFSGETELAPLPDAWFDDVPFLTQAAGDGEEKSWWHAALSSVWEGAAPDEFAVGTRTTYAKQAYASCGEVTSAKGLNLRSSPTVRSDNYVLTIGQGGQLQYAGRTINGAKYDWDLVTYDDGARSVTGYVAYRRNDNKHASNIAYKVCSATATRNAPASP